VVCSDIVQVPFQFSGEGLGERARHSGVTLFLGVMARCRFGRWFRLGLGAPRRCLLALGLGLLFGLISLGLRRCRDNVDRRLADVLAVPGGLEALELVLVPAFAGTLRLGRRAICGLSDRKSVV